MIKAMTREQTVAFLKSFSFSSVKILKHSKRNSVKSGRQSASLITELVINRCSEEQYFVIIWGIR